MAQRIAVVTGGMGGLGEAICMKLARMDIKVVVTFSPSNTKSEAWLKEMAARDYHFHGYAADVAYSAERGCPVTVIARDNDRHQRTIPMFG